jgi:hypothetical protein
MTEPPGEIVKSLLLFSALSLLSFGVFAEAEPQPKSPTMKFTSLPLAQRLRDGEAKITPYRAEDTVMVQIEDTINCGQQPVNPSFEIDRGRLLLRYDLAVDNAAISGQTCAAHSSFLLREMPDRDLEVSFAHRGGPEMTARMVRCPGKAIHDAWDCLLPQRSGAIKAPETAPAPAIDDDARPAQAPELKFTSQVFEKRVGAAERKISPYRAEDTIFALVEEPITCGQTATHPSFRLGESALDLSYTLSDAPPGQVAEECTLKSVFQVSQMPHRDLDVTFGNRTGAFIVAQMARCGRAGTSHDPWDCLLPKKEGTASAAATAPPAAAAPSMNYYALPISRSAGGRAPTLRPFRNRNVITAIVEAPIVCGQRPYMPSFETVGNRLNLSFQLSPAPAGTAQQCTALASFQITNVPDRDFEVAFSAGNAPPVVATMETCARGSSATLAWNCMVPSSGK